MVMLGEDIIFESSERSNRYNWVSNQLKQAGFVLASFEGYTVMAEKVSLLLDRARFSGQSIQYTSASLVAKLGIVQGFIQKWAIWGQRIER
jgi:hypothetical protein